MTNLDRLKLEIKGIDLTDDELTVYLMEEDLTANNEYNPTSNMNKRNIFKAALNILESIANNPELMKNYKMDDMSISQFHENLQDRIDNLNKRIRLIPDDAQTYIDGADFFYMFTN